MPRIELVEPTEAEGHETLLLDRVQASLGATPNVFRTMARSAVLEAHLAFSAALRKGSIGAADGERIALAMAERNACTYCLSAHSYLGANVAKLDAAELENARRFRSREPKSAALLSFAEALVRSQGGLGEREMDAARAAGLSDAELGDVVAHVALNVLTNYFNRAFDVEVDFRSSPHAHAVAIGVAGLGGAVAGGVLADRIGRATTTMAAMLASARVLPAQPAGLRGAHAGAGGRAAAVGRRRDRRLGAVLGRRHPTRPARLRRLGAHAAARAGVRADGRQHPPRAAGRRPARQRRRRQASCSRSSSASVPTSGRSRPRSAGR